MKDPTLYVPVHAGLFSHRKLRRLAARLSIQQVHAVGHLVGLWTTALQQTTDGVLRRWDELDVADAARWTGKPSDLVEALVAEEWLDRSAVAADDLPAGTLSVRGWDDYAGRGLAMREREKKRKADQRKKGKGPSLSADNPALYAVNDGLSAEVPSQLSEAKRSEAELSEAELNEAELNEAEGEGALAPEVLPAENRALEAARADVVRDNRNARLAKRAAAEAIYGRPQSVDALLALVGAEGETLEQVLAKKYPLFDGVGDHPSIADRVATLWTPFTNQAWSYNGRDAIRWLTTRLSEDHQKLRQSEMIIAEKKARGVGLAESDDAVAERKAAADAARAAYDAYCDTMPPQERLARGCPTWAAWSQMGRPARYTGPQGSGGASLTPPPQATQTPPKQPAQEVSDAQAQADRERMFAALGRIGTGAKKRPLMPSREALDRQLPPTLASDGADR